jgi:hypothetical protein
MAQQKNNRVNLRFDDDELESVAESAIASGFGTAKRSGAASYARAVVLGYNPPSVFDQQVIAEVCRLHAHLGKIGGLFKLAISEEQGDDTLRVYVSEILKTQREVKELISDIRDGKFSG